MNTLPETAHGTLELLYNTKAQNERMAWQIVREIEEGNVPALKVHLSVKSIENLLKQLTDKTTNEELSERFKSLVLDEADKYAEKSFELHGAKFTKSEVGVKYNYSACGDVVWDELDSEIKALEAKRKEREEYLKKIPQDGITILVDDEVIKLYPPVKTSTSTINVTLPKQ